MCLFLGCAASPMFLVPSVVRCCVSVCLYVYCVCMSPYLYIWFDAGRPLVVDWLVDRRRLFARVPSSLGFWTQVGRNLHAKRPARDKHRETLRGMRCCVSACFLVVLLHPCCWFPLWSGAGRHLVVDWFVNRYRLFVRFLVLSGSGRNSATTRYRFGSLKALRFMALGVLDVLASCAPCCAHVLLLVGGARRGTGCSVLLRCLASPMFFVAFVVWCWAAPGGELTC